MDAGVTNRYFELFTSYLDTRTILNLRFYSDDIGDSFFYGNAILTGLSMDAPNQQTTTLNVSFVGAGELNTQTSTPA